MKRGWRRAGKASPPREMGTQEPGPTRVHFRNVFCQKGSQQRGQLSTISPKEASPAESNNDRTLKSMFGR